MRFSGNSSQDIGIEWFFDDGDEVPANAVLCRLSGPARAIVDGRKNGAELAADLVGNRDDRASLCRAVAGTGCKVLDTRKTLPV